jgi:pimeloyl-ACP methyl ester carboxylesterase
MIRERRPLGGEAIVRHTDPRYTEQIVTATLINVLTGDDLVHTGALFSPQTAARPLALLWVHGGGQNFYYPTYQLIGAATSACGYAFLSANTRGHDQNSRWDRFESSALDLVAWIDCLGALGYQQVVLIGHSFGGYRVASYQAERQDTRVRGLIIASTPVRKRSFFSQRPHYQERLEVAERMLAEGQGDQYMPMEYPQTAVSFVSFDRAQMDLYGLEGSESLLSRAGCPVLAWFGTEGREPSIGTAADLQLARASLPQGFPFETVLLKGSDHMYRGHEEEVAATISRWADCLTR